MCIDKSWPSGGPDWAAVGVLLREGSVLLIKRVEREGDPWSGQVAFPGGRWKPGEDLMDTVVREVEEEVGVRPTALVGVLPPQSPSKAQPQGGEGGPVDFQGGDVRGGVDGPARLRGGRLGYMGPYLQDFEETY